MFINRTEYQTKSSHIFSSLRLGRFLRHTKKIICIFNHICDGMAVWPKKRDIYEGTSLFAQINHGLTVSGAMHSLDGSEARLDRMAT